MSEKNYRIALIGESSGNGHPFSWQSIFNGYNPQTIENCGFPVIHEYLAKESWDKDHIPNFKITKVWTNNPSRTEFIASTSSLCKPCQNFEDLFDEIDAFIVARDDYYPNELILKRVLQQGKPILFDKQISYSLKSTKSMIDLANSYKVPIISGSAIGFDENLNVQELMNNPDCVHIVATSPKVWFNYGIHIVDPFSRAFLRSKNYHIKSKKILEPKRSLEDGITLIIERENMNDLRIDLRNSQLYQESFKYESFDQFNKLIKKLIHKDTFTAFKNYLIYFSNIVKEYNSTSTFPTKEIIWNHKLCNFSCELLDIIKPL